MSINIERSVDRLRDRIFSGENSQRGFGWLVHLGSGVVLELRGFTYVNR